MKVKTLHQGLVLCLFALTPLANLLCFLICISVSLFWGGVVVVVNTLAVLLPFITALISYGNIIFNLLLFDLCPLFQEDN
jgi:hypothetical protein